MTDLQAKLTDMRDAAERLQLTSKRIDQSVQSATDAIDGLFAMGLNNPSLQANYVRFRGSMVTWAGTLQRFADELADAADMIETAARTESVRFSLGRQDHPSEVFTPVPADAPAAPPKAPDETAVLHPFAYIAAHNEPLYQRWQEKQAALNSREAQLAALISTRDERTADLTALRHRLHSYEPLTNPDSIPRVQALGAELEQLDTQINSLQVDVREMRAEFHALTHRLDLLTPGEGADLTLIASMEDSASPPWLAENTFDCVAHVVEKFHVPPDIARDAYLWVEQAAAFPEYGVTVGDVPMEGAVLWMDQSHPYSDPAYGHVMYVEKIENGVVWVTDNNHPTEPVRFDAITDPDAGPVQYLYFPWHTRG